MSIKEANILLPRTSHYRFHIFQQGLECLGYKIVYQPNHGPKSPDDILVLWNRSPTNERIAVQYEKAGAKVIVSENGYLGRTKALALSHHNGAGHWNVSSQDRWSKLGIELKPWRKTGNHILILPQRGIGEPGIAMPRNWLIPKVDHLKRITDRPIKIRMHPGKNKCKPLEEDLANAWAVVTWGSGAAIKAIVEGIPVFHTFDQWIGAKAARMGLDLEHPYLGDRMDMLHRLTYAQWTYDEIRSGEAFRCLLRSQ